MTPLGQRVYGPYSGTFASLLPTAGGRYVSVCPPRLTVDAYLALPESDAAHCPDGHEAFDLAGVSTCPWHDPALQWRWPADRGLD